MRQKKSFVFLVITLLAVFQLNQAEARFGGGRSFGSRGFRGTPSRSSWGHSSGGYSRTQSPYGYGNSNTASRESYSRSIPPSSGSGSFLKGLAGGIAGGFIGSLLFRNIGHAGYGATPPSPGGIGLLEIILLAGLGFFIYQYFQNRKRRDLSGVGAMSHYDQLRSVEPGPYAQPQSPESEQDLAGQLQKYDAQFQLEQFKEERMDDFIQLQSAWNQRDLSSVAHLMTPELKKIIDEDLQELKNSHRINRLENIAVRKTELTETWQEYGLEYATLRIRANLVDYTIDETTGNVISGDKTRSEKFEEDWTFVRKVGESSSTNAWKLSAIQN